MLVSAARPIDSGLAAPLGARFDAAYPALPADALSLRVSEPVYDAMYYLAFALDGAGSSQEFGAAQLRDGLLRVSDAAGPVATVGPADWAAARALLRNEALNLQGSSGPAAFDTQSRTRAGVASVRCWDPQGSLVDRATYDAETGTFVARPAPCLEGAF